MLIIGINGSPNTDGNTATLLTRILETSENLGANTQLLHAGELIKSTGGSSFCTVCNNPCPGICYEGKPLQDAFNLLRAADALILGSPVYFGTISSQLKAIFDKTRKLRSEKSLYNTIGAAVSVGGSTYGGQETTIRTLHDIMLVHGMLIVGDGFKDDDCGHLGVCAKRPVLDDTPALKRADILAHRIVEVCQATQSLRQH